MTTPETTNPPCSSPPSAAVAARCSRCVWTLVLCSSRATATRASATVASCAALRCGSFLSGEDCVDNGHGWFLPWAEEAHQGHRPDLDNEMRSALLAETGH